MHLSYKPTPPLATFIKSLWLYEGQTSPHTRERVLPDGGLAVLLNLAEDHFLIPDHRQARQTDEVTGGLIVGPRTEFNLIDTSRPLYMIGVQFKPGGALPFFQLPLSELQNLQLSLSDLWPEYDRLREAMTLAPTPSQKFTILENTLAARLDHSQQFHPAVTFLLTRLQSGPTPPTQADLTTQVGLSERRMIALFKQQVGLTPYQFYRVRRFQRLLGRLNPGHLPDWADLALSVGYFDQAHLIHDFQAFAGVTPTAYMRRASPYQNHIPVAN